MSAPRAVNDADDHDAFEKVQIAVVPVAEVVAPVRAKPPAVYAVPAVLVVSLVEVYAVVVASSVADEV